MKLAKSLLLGSAAALAATAGAQAADLPSMKAAPVAYVQICDAYGAGFWYIPGTDICLKVGGIVQARYVYSSTGNLLALSQTYSATTQKPNSAVLPGGLPLTAATNSAYAQNYQPASGLDDYGTYMRTYLSLDARDQTPYGTLRAYILLSLITYGGYAAANGNVQGTFSAATPQTGPAAGITYNQTLPSISQGIIQFAGITAGRAVSMSGFYKGANNWGSTYLESEDTVNLLAYTGTFGGGFSATVSLEDSDYHDPGVVGLDQNILPYSATALGPIITPAAPAGIAHQGITATEGNYRLPDVVGVLRLDQAWGAIQLSGALHQIATQALNGTSPLGPLNLPIGGTPATTSPAGTPATLVTAQKASSTGYGGELGVEFNLPQLAAGDQLWLEAAYANGALDYAGVDTQDAGNLSTDDNFGITRLTPGLMRFDRDAIAVENAAGTGYFLDKEKAWSLLGNFQHYWTPSLRSNLYGNYINVTPGTTTRLTDWTEGGLSAANEWRIGGNLIWTASRGFDIGVDVMYVKLNQKLTCNGVCSAANPGTALPAGIAISPDAVQATIRLQRTF